MNTNDILRAIDDQISRLHQAKVLLSDASNPGQVKRRAGRGVATDRTGRATTFNPAASDPKPKRRRTLSAAGRKRIAAAQRARWARIKDTAASK